MIVLQYIIILFVLVAWTVALLKLKDKKIGPGEFLFWSILWISLLILSLFPSIPTKVSALLGVGRGVDLVIYGSIFLLFFLAFKIYSKLEEQDRKMTRLVRELALERARKK